MITRYDSPRLSRRQEKIRRNLAPSVADRPFLIAHPAGQQQPGPYSEPRVDADRVGDHVGVCRRRFARRSSIGTAPSLTPDLDRHVGALPVHNQPYWQCSIAWRRTSARRSTDGGINGRVVEQQAVSAQSGVLQPVNIGRWLIDARRRSITLSVAVAITMPHRRSLSPSERRSLRFRRRVSRHAERCRRSFARKTSVKRQWSPGAINAREVVMALPVVIAARAAQMARSRHAPMRPRSSVQICLPDPFTAAD